MNHRVISSLYKNLILLFVATVSLKAGAVMSTNSESFNSLPEELTENSLRELNISLACINPVNKPFDETLSEIIQLSHVNFEELKLSTTYDVHAFVQNAISRSPLSQDQINAEKEAVSEYASQYLAFLAPFDSSYFLLLNRLEVASFYLKKAEKYYNDVFKNLIASHRSGVAKKVNFGRAEIKVLNKSELTSLELLAVSNMQKVFEQSRCYRLKVNRYAEYLKSL